MAFVFVLGSWPRGGRAQDKSVARGYVLDSAGTPIRNATVLLQPDNIRFPTDDNGYFEGPPAYLGTYRYIITAMGYRPDSGYLELTHPPKVETYKLIRESRQIGEISVTGKRKERGTLIDPSNSSMPVTVIDRKEIDLLGSKRLDEVISAQTGMAIVSNTSGGNRSLGVQMQGLSSQYIMILLDGQPLMGRQSGNLDLSRISVANVERIEIIKGASSCLYGNEALGGAINIITRYGTNHPQLHLRQAYGSYNTWDLTAEAESNFNDDKGYFMLSGNFYKTDGFNTNKQYLASGTTVPPYDNLAVQGKIRHRIVSEDQYLSLSFRSNNRASRMIRQYTDDYELQDHQQEREWNLSLSFDKRWNAAWKSLSTYHFSSYHSGLRVHASVQDQELNSDVFDQLVHRFDHQIGYNSERLNLTFGLQTQVEGMDVQQTLDRRTQYSIAAYSQGNYAISPRTGITAGLRFDHTLGYDSRLSPSLGVDHQLLPGLSWKSGVAFGFRAPDFRTRYQTFYNPAANYYLIGNQVLNETLAEMDQQGQISEIRKYAVEQAGGPLKAERNVSVNSGLSYQPLAGTAINVNFFYHRLANQINSLQVATGVGNMMIFSFQNLPRAENKGLELNFNSTLLPGLEFSGGYQYLIAKDLGVQDSIKSGVWPYSRNIHDPETGQSYAPVAADYWGLENRSRHQLNMGLTYEFAPWNITASLRAVFRGRYPFMDRNGNQFIDKHDIFVDGHILYHAGVEKKFNRLPLYLRLNMDNMTDYVNYLIPGQLGRATTFSISYRFIKK